MIDQHQGPSEPAGWPEPEPTAAPTAGIDRASTERAVAVVGAHGTEQKRFVVAHTGPGSAGWCGGWRMPGWPRSESSARTVWWSMRSSRPSSR